MGNAEPTPASFAAWVPHDGQITDPLHNTKYPVTQEEINLSVGPYSAANNNSTHVNQVNQDEVLENLKQNFQSNEQQFDIIVLGMQEAAFVHKNKQTSQKELLDVSNASSRDGAEDAAATPSTSHHTNNTTNSEHCAATNNNSPNNNKGKGFNPLKKGAKKAANVTLVMRGVSANKTYTR